MNTRTPTFRQHRDGRYLTKWGGRNRYFGRDLSIARKLFAVSLGEWAQWADERRAYLQSRPDDTLRVSALAEQFLESVRRESSSYSVKYYKGTLRRFLFSYGKLRAGAIRVVALHGIKDDMIDEGMSPKTINGTIIAIRTMFRWAEDRELVKPVNLRGCRSIPLGPLVRKAWCPTAVRLMVHRAGNPLAPWLAFAYLSLARPTEVVRCIHGQGEWSERGVFRLDRGKADKKSTIHRHLVVSDRALVWWKRCRPAWSTAESYAQAVKRVLGHAGGSHPLRHSAATHLAALGTSREDIDLLLGHMPPRVSLTYTGIAWQLLRQTANQLDVQPVS